LLQELIDISKDVTDNMQKKMKDNPYKKQKGRKNYKSMAISHIGINHNE